MTSLRTATRAVSVLAPRLPQPAVRWASSGAGGRPRPRPRRLTRRRRGGGYLGFFATAFLAGAAYYAYITPETAKRKAKAVNVVIPKAEVVFEPPRTAGGSPQDRQIQSSLDNPGVYAWGSNAGRVVAPDSTDAVVKEPRRLPAFDGQVLRDLRLDRNVGVAVTEKGDVLQWGVGFWGKSAAAATASSSSSSSLPVATLTGKDIVKVTLSQDRVIALSASGTVYSLPVSQSDQQQLQLQVSTASNGPAASSSWWGLWSSTPSPSATHARNMTPSGLGWGERVVDVSAGLEHCLLLTSKGRVFSAVATSESFPARGQLGLPGVSWESRPAGPLDQPHEVLGLHGIAVKQIATGDYHSLVLSKDGRVFAFGNNTAGQLGIKASPTFPLSDVPVSVPIDKLYEASAGDKAPTPAPAVSARAAALRPPQVTSIAAGGATSFFTVDAEEVVGRGDRGSIIKRDVADTWSCGSGIYGTLGTGKWVHISTAGPSKIKALSGLAEYSEAQGKMVPIRLASLAVGATHASAVLSNATHVSSSSSSSTAAKPTDTNWGADVLWWGGNEFCQLGTGKRNNVNEPVHIGPLDRLPAAGSEGSEGPAGSAGSAGRNETERSLDGDRERLEIVPRTTVVLHSKGKTRKVSTEQRVVCGRFVSGVYSAT